MGSYLIVFIGAGLGGMARHGVNMAAARFLGFEFPYGTLIVNVVGSLLMGLVAGYFAARGHVSNAWQLFLTTGILGGFTTFSAFSLDAAALYERGATWAFVGYVVGSVGLSLIALFLGLAAMRPGFQLP